MTLYTYIYIHMCIYICICIYKGQIKQTLITSPTTFSSHSNSSSCLTAEQQRGVADQILSGHGMRGVYPWILFHSERWWNLEAEHQPNFRNPCQQSCYKCWGDVLNQLNETFENFWLPGFQLYGCIQPRRNARDPNNARFSQHTQKKNNRSICKLTCKHTNRYMYM